MVDAFIGGALLRFATGRFSIRLDSISILFGAAALWMRSLSSASPSRMAGPARRYRWLTPALFFVFAGGYFDRPSALRVGAAICALSVGVAAWAFFQVIRDSGPESFHRNGLIRVYGGFGEPNPFAAFVVFCALVLLGAAWAAPTIWWRYLFATGAVLGIATTVLTQSRGGLLALASGLGVLGLCALVRQPRLIRVSAICRCSRRCRIGGGWIRRAGTLEARSNQCNVGQLGRTGTGGALDGSLGDDQGPPVVWGGGRRIQR